MRQRIVLEGEFEAGFEDDEGHPAYVQFGNRTGIDGLESWIVHDMDWDNDRCLDGKQVRITVEALEDAEKVETERALLQEMAEQFVTIFDDADAEIRADKNALEWLTLTLTKLRELTEPLRAANRGEAVTA